MDSLLTKRLAFIGVVSLITFLSYGPPVLFRYIDPGALGRKDFITFNLLVVCIWTCYLQACFTDPGHVSAEGKVYESGGDFPVDGTKSRWCRRCSQPKPPRAHHCKICQRCIPKMDHHCPWTINCVSHRTFPHFIRFLFYSVSAMICLEYFLFVRLSLLWSSRALPSYLGPSHAQLILLFIFSMVNSITLFALTVMLVRNIWILGSNVTTIEGWEIERHETLVRRANARGGYLDGPDGVRIRIAKQEFPYDVGIYQNARQGMGSTFLLWLWPFASTPSSSTGLDFETNGFEDPGSSWPPPDPERIPRRRYKIADRNPFTYGADASVLDMQGFRERQYQDALRLASGRDSSLGRASFLREGSNSLRQDTDDESNNAGTAASWWDPAGEQLQDFGVDEEAEWKEEDNIPLGEMLKYRKTARLQEGLEDE